MTLHQDLEALVAELKAPTAQDDCTLYTMGQRTGRIDAADRLQSILTKHAGEALDHRNTLELAEYQPEANPACWCLTCDPVTVRMALCPDCGNKRCPKANDHRHACTGSNEPGQKGSVWEHVSNGRG